jgi:hypothetical protein
MCNEYERVKKIGYTPSWVCRERKRQSYEEIKREAQNGRCRKRHIQTETECQT